MAIYIAIFLVVVAIGIFVFDRISKSRAAASEADTSGAPIKDLTSALRNDNAMVSIKKRLPAEKRTQEPRKIEVKSSSEEIVEQVTSDDLVFVDIVLPEVVERGSRMEVISFSLQNSGNHLIAISQIFLQFQVNGKSVTHDYTVRANASNPSRLEANGSVNLSLSVDIGHKANIGIVDVIPEISAQIDGKEITVNKRSQWKVEPKGRVFVVTTQNEGSEIAGTPFSLKIETALEGRIDKLYEGRRRVFFTTSDAGSPDYPSEIPEYIDLQFKEGRVTTKECFCFYNILETPTITALDEASGGARGSSMKIALKPAVTGSFQLTIHTPQNNGVGFQGENTLTALDLYNNPKIDYHCDTVISTSAERCKISGLGGANGNVVPGDAFTDGVVNLTHLEMMVAIEGLQEPKLLQFVAEGDGAMGKSDLILIVANSGRSPDQEQRAASSIHRTILGLKRKQIWIANCEPDIEQMLQKNFEDEYDMRPVKLTDEKIDTISEQKPDVLFLDAGNPSVDGYEIMRKIRSKPEMESLPILFFGSPYESEGKILSVLKNGGAYVTKPLTIPAIKARVTELLESTGIWQGRLPVRGARLQGSDGLLYRVISKIGEGGMGHIYEAERLRDHQKVIIKYLPPAEFRNMKAILRFVQEAFTVINFDHENLVQGYDLFMDRNRCFYVMELIDGKTLEAVIHEKGKLDPGRAVDATLQIARALEFLAQEHHIVHRDIKPANILITRNGVVKVVDFGIAKATDRQCAMTTRGIILGTPYYLSPEQILGKEITIQSDIYSLGATFYHMLTGKVPFQGDDVLEIIHQRLTSDPVFPSIIEPQIPQAISRTVMKMMERKPARRHDSASALIYELETIKARIKDGTLEEDQVPQPE